MGDSLETYRQQLNDLVSIVRGAPESDTVWRNIEIAAQSLANGLRVKNGPVDNHTALGKSDLPQTLATLLALAPQESSKDLVSTPALFEILRVAANLCMDHDDNRSHLLDAQIPQATLSLLEGYAESVPPPPYLQPLLLSVPHLKVVRTAIGVLLNASIGHDSVKERLNSLEASSTILKLSAAIYPPGSWLNDSSEGTVEDLTVSWSLRSGMASWTRRTLSELNDVKEETVATLSPAILPLLTSPLRLYMPPYSSNSGSFSESSAIFPSLVHADFEAVEESCTLIESLSLDVEDIRLSLARGFQFVSEHGGVPCLSDILEFIDKGDYSPLWTSSPQISEADRKRMKKSLDMCKAALIKCVVEVAGEGGNEDILWDESEGDEPGGAFVCTMVEWIKRFVRDSEEGKHAEDCRDDLVICGSLSLGNLTRRENHVSLLLAQPHSLASVLTSIHLLSPSADIKMKHGVIGLLKNLVQASIQSPELQIILANAGIVRCVAGCGVWDEKADVMAEIIQVSAIGVVKHMCNANVENTLALVLPSSPAASPSTTGLAQILALVKRSDSIPIKSEGTRVLVNVVKSLFSAGPVSSPVAGGPNPIVNGTVDTEALQEIQQRKQAALRAVLTLESACALANLVARSDKHPLLVNEGVVALSLLSTLRTGAGLVMKALTESVVVDVLEPLPPTEPPSASTSTNSDISSPVMTTPSTRHGGSGPVHRTALDFLMSALKNIDSPVIYQVEIRMNICSLLIQLGKNASGDGLRRLQETVRPILNQLHESLQNAQGREEQLQKQIEKLLEA